VILVIRDGGRQHKIMGRTPSKILVLSLVTLGLASGAVVSGSAVASSAPGAGPSSSFGLSAGQTCPTIPHAKLRASSSVGSTNGSRGIRAGRPNAPKRVATKPGTSGPATARARIRGASGRRGEGTRHRAACGVVLFNGAKVSAWFRQSATATRVVSVPNPSGAPGHVLKFTALNSDVWPRTPTANPRAQLVTPDNVVRPGDRFWESYEIYLPTTFPVAQTMNGWLALGSPFYGAPWNGSPSVGLEITDGDFRWATNEYAQVPWHILWQRPIVTGRWIRFTWDINPSAAGFAELYVNDVAVHVNYDRHQQHGAHLPVMDQTNSDGPWESQLSAYFKLNEFAKVTIYFKDFRIATTQGAAEGQG
jgi:hypothetical protein